MERMDFAKSALAFFFAAALSLQPSRGTAEPLTITVADFDYKDTSGEVRDQSAEPKARVAHFRRARAEEIFPRKATTGVLPLDCPKTSLHAYPHGTGRFHRCRTRASPARGLWSMAASTRRAR